MLFVLRPPTSITDGMLGLTAPVLKWLLTNTKEIFFIASSKEMYRSDGKLSLRRKSKLNDRVHHMYLCVLLVNLFGLIFEILSNKQFDSREDEIFHAIDEIQVSGAQ